MTSPGSMNKVSSSGPFPLKTVLFLVAVCAVAFAVRFAFVRSLTDDLPWRDAREYHVLALEMQHSWEYKNSAGSPVAYWPPGYPYFLGFTYRALSPSVHAARAAQSALGALTCLLCYLIALRLLDRRSATLAAALTAFYPLMIYTAVTLYPAALQTFLLACVVYLCLLARGVGRSLSSAAAGGVSRGSAAAALVAGVVAASSALVTPSSLPALVLAAAWLAWPAAGAEWRVGRRRLILVLLFLLPVGLALGGWSYRNYRALGRPIAVSANGGFNFWLGNHPDVTATTGNRMTPRMRVELGAVYAKYRNVAVRDSVLYAMGLHYASSNPGRFVRLSAAKALNFWRLYPQPMTEVTPVAGKEKLLSLLSYGVLLPFGVVWLFRSLRRSAGAILILLVFIAYTLVHAVFISKVRYRIPIDLYMIIYASGALLALLDLLRRRAGGRAAPERA